MDRLSAMQVFARVVELGSFSRAATALSLSRARTSEAVQALEAALGTRLLHRTTRRLSLTDDGRAYYERVTRILADVAEAETEIVRSRGSARGRLRVDLPVALARLFVVPKLKGLLKRHPELELELRLENRSIDLTREGVDCAITYGEPEDPELVAQRLATTHLVTCAAPSYLERRGVPREPSELARHNAIAFLALRPARPTAWRFVRDGAEFSEEPRGNLAFNSMEACVDAAVAGLGTTQVLSSVAHIAIREGKLTPLLVDFASPGPTLFLAFPPNRHASARLRAFAQFAKEVFAAVDAGWQEIVALSRPKQAPLPATRARPILKPDA
jgi:LysR family transcriptional regulator for bpeEF and oprC